MYVGEREMFSPFLIHLFHRIFCFLLICRESLIQSDLCVIFKPGGSPNLTIPCGGVGVPLLMSTLPLMAGYYGPAGAWCMTFDF
ncbi:hypothetical protein cypCar_00032703 [Cyprinus carpio]|nr:hypothetical protein cypCar_00032703 [Cyprinus carpio]